MGQGGGSTGSFLERGQIMKIRVGGKKCHFVGMSLLLLLFLSVFLVCTASAVDQPKGTLGVALGEITPDIKQAAGLQAVNGAMIQQVLPDSAAARGGLPPRD